MGKPKRAVGEDEKKIRETRVIIQRSLGWITRDSSLQIISTDTVFGDRHKNFCQLKSGTLD